MAELTRHREEIVSPVHANLTAVAASIARLG